MITDEKYVRKSDSNIPGMDNMIPIHFTARYGTECKDIKGTLKIMMNFTDEMNATLQKDKTGYTVLDHAMQSGRVDIVKTIIEISDCWKELLRVKTKSKKKGFYDILDTPMRQLIKDFPEAAEKVLDKCKEEDTKNKSTTYINEFLEDTYKYRLEKENDGEGISFKFIHVTEVKKDEKMEKKEK